jgi:hypothetical protein
LILYLDILFQKLVVLNHCLKVAILLQLLAIEVLLEMLKKSDLLLKFWWKLRQTNFLEVVNEHKVAWLLLVLRLGAIDVVDGLCAFLLTDHLRVVIEEYTHCLIRHDVAQTIFGGVIDPLFEKDVVDASLVFDGVFLSRDLACGVATNRCRCHGSAH